MKTLISGCMKRTSGQAHFRPRSCVTTVMMALLLTTSNLTATPLVTTLGGGTSPSFYGYADGNTLYAQFHTPIGLATDSSGDYLYVADRDNNAIRELDLVYTNTFMFATNSISHPVGVAVDSLDDVFVLNRGNGSNGTVLEFDQYGDLIATNAMGLINAAGIAMDYTGNIYVTVQSNKLIRIAAGTTNQTTIATIAIAGTSLQGIVVKYNGLIAACDSGRNGILLINPNTSVITTNAGFNGADDNFIIGTYEFPYTTGVPKANAKFNQPYGVAEVGDGGLIVTDCGNNRVKVVNAAGVVTNLYGVNSYYWWTGETLTKEAALLGWSDGTVLVPDQVGDVQARQPVGVCFSSDGTVYTTEDYYHIIRHVTANFTPLPPPPPAAPMNLTATATSGQVVLTWTASSSSGVTNYNVKRSPSSGGPYTIIGSTPSTTYTDTNVMNGTTYYYVVSALNAGGEGPNSAEVSATPPIPPPSAPRIGWFDYEGPPGEQTTVLHPVSGANYYTANNDLLMAIDPGTNGLSTYYIATNGPQPVLAVPSSTNGSTPPPYQDGWSYAQPLPVTTMPDLVIKAVNVGPGGTGQIATAEFLFQVANPTIIGANAAQFTVSDITSGAQLWYTTDGSDPTNAAPSQSAGTITGTNDITLSLPLPDNTNMTFKVRGFRDGYSPSGIAVQSFSSSNFVPNTISFGFASGEASSDFVGSPGQTFYAPVTLSVLPSQTIYSLQFNVTVTNVGSDSITPGAFGFQSMLVKPVTESGTTVYHTIPPWMFAADDTNGVPPSQLETNSAGQVFVNLETLNTNINLLGVGWLERAGKTNLYDTTAQDLIQYSMAHDTLFLQATGKVVVGGYSFQLPEDAAPGEQYQIQIGRPSATSDGIGAPGSSVFIYAPTNGSLTAGAINSIKLVTAGQRKYLVGNVYPFSWFNAGDFGNTNLQNADVMQVFQSAIYSWNYPPPRSDFFNAMDSCGNIGTLDGLTGYYTNDDGYPFKFPYTITNTVNTYDINTNFISGTTNVLNLTNEIYMDTLSFSAISTITSDFPTFTNVEQVVTPYNFTNSYVPGLFDVDGSDTNINQIVFGDGVLNVCDVYVTFRRSLDSTLTWYRRFWTNGVLVADTIPNVFNPGVVSKSSPVAGKIVQPAIGAGTSVTNQPQVNFTAGDFQTAAGQTIQIPITASVFGSYPLRVLMLNLTVVPLDGSPALTTQVQFTPSTALGAPTSGFTANDGGPGNYAAAWLDNSIAGLTGDVNLGTLTVAVPANATSLSAYAVHFDHASASPNGLASFPKQTLTGLITLSSRTNSAYGDGIPDLWRLRWFGTVNNILSVSNACPSGDGINNWKKYVAGVDPNTPNDFPSLNPKTPVPAGATAAIHWPSVAGKQYVILRSSSLFNGSWTAIATNTGTGADMEFDDTTTGQPQFYRVQVLP